jgi:hypothetical protein
MYTPVVKSLKCIRRYRLAPFSFQLFSEIENFTQIEGMTMKPIEYLYILAAYQDGETQACLFVASEKNQMDGWNGTQASHFLGVFTDSKHINLGASNDWADLELFTTRALSVAVEHLGLSGTPEHFVSSKGFFQEKSDR